MCESVDTRPSLPQLWEAGPGYEAREALSSKVPPVVNTVKITRVVVQALCSMASHKLQQKPFHLFCTLDGILFNL